MFNFNKRLRDALEYTKDNTKHKGIFFESGYKNNTRDVSFKFYLDSETCLGSFRWGWWDDVYNVYFYGKRKNINLTKKILKSYIKKIEREKFYKEYQKKKDYNVSEDLINIRLKKKIKYEE